MKIWKILYTRCYNLQRSFVAPITWQWDTFNAKVSSCYFLNFRKSAMNVSMLVVVVNPISVVEVVILFRSVGIHRCGRQTGLHLYKASFERNLMWMVYFWSVLGSHKLHLLFNEIWECRAQIFILHIQIYVIELNGNWIETTKLIVGICFSVGHGINKQ